MSFLPCTDPLKFEVVADVPSYPFNFTLEVGKRQTISRNIPVPGELLMKSVIHLLVEKWCIHYLVEEFIAIFN